MCSSDLTLLQLRGKEAVIRAAVSQVKPPDPDSEERIWLDFVVAAADPQQRRERLKRAVQEYEDLEMHAKVALLLWLPPVR